MAVDPAFLIFGPSGSGKSTVAGWLAADLDYLHIEADRWPDPGCGEPLLRLEWSAFAERHDHRPLLSVLRDRARAERRAGAVLSLPSFVLVPPELMQKAARDGLHSVILYGSGAECLHAFLDRERRLDRGLGVDHWIKHNAAVYAHMSRPEFAPHRVSTFQDGRPRPRADLVAEIAARV